MRFEIINDRLVIDGKPVRFVQVPHTSGARIEPQAIVYHDTAGSSMESSLSWFLDARSKVSAHLIIGRNAGEIVQCVEFDRVAWHAGPSKWENLVNLNGSAIGIELDNVGGLDASGYSKATRKTYADSVSASSPKHSGKRWVPYTEWQLEVLEGITRALTAYYPHIRGCCGHWEIDTRGWKEDPTPLFPWERMRAAMGERLHHVAATHVDHESVQAVQQRLNELHYGAGFVDGLMGARTRSALEAFQEQHRIQKSGQIDDETWARLFVTRDDLPAPKEFPLGNRAELTAVKGSRISALATASRIGALGIAGYQVGSSLVESAVSLGDAAEAVGTVESALQLLERVDELVPRLEKFVAWLQTPPGLKTIGILALIWLGWWGAGKLKAWRVQMARSGNPA